MRSPVAAISWEIACLIRRTLVWRFALAVMVGLVATRFGDRHGISGATLALVALVVPHFGGWSLVPGPDRQPPGFPLRHLFVRPVATGLLVGLPMFYLTVASAFVYLASAWLLRLLSGYPFPLLSVALWITSLNLVYLAIHWSSRRHSVVAVLGIVACVVWVLPALEHLPASPGGWGRAFRFSPAGYLAMVVAGVASFGISVASVACQRRGDAASGWNPQSGFPGWLVDLFHLRLSVSSPLRAQMWFELRSRGLPLITIGLVLALLIPSLFALAGLNVGTSFPRMGAAAALFAGASVAVVLALGGSAFARTSLEAIQPGDSRSFASLKILVRAACVLAALIAVVASVWLSQSLFALRIDDAFDGHYALLAAVAAMSGLEKLALSFVIVVGVIIWVAVAAAIPTLWRLQRGGMNRGLSWLFFGGIALVALNAAGAAGYLPATVPDAIFAATRGIVVAGLLAVLVILLWQGASRRLFALPHAVGVLAVCVAFAAAWIAVLGALGAPLGGRPLAEMISRLWPALLPAVAAALALWSFDRMRHV